MHCHNMQGTTQDLQQHQHDLDVSQMRWRAKCAIVPWAKG